MDNRDLIHGRVKERSFFFLVAAATRPALGPIQPHIKRVSTFPCSAEVKNALSCTSTPQYVFEACWLVVRRDIFTFKCIVLCRSADCPCFV